MRITLAHRCAVPLLLLTSLDMVNLLSTTFSDVHYNCKGRKNYAGILLKPKDKNFLRCQLSKMQCSINVLVIKKLFF